MGPANAKSTKQCVAHTQNARAWRANSASVPSAAEGDNAASSPKSRPPSCKPPGSSTLLDSSAPTMAPALHALAGTLDTSVRGREHHGAPSKLQSSTPNKLKSHPPSKQKKSSAKKATKRNRTKRGKKRPRVTLVYNARGKKRASPATKRKFVGTAKVARTARALERAIKRCEIASRARAQLTAVNANPLDDVSDDDTVSEDQQDGHNFLPMSLSL